MRTWRARLARDAPARGAPRPASRRSRPRACARAATRSNRRLLRLFLLLRQLAGRQAIGVRLRRPAALEHVRHAHRRDREAAGVIALNEPLLSQVPEMEPHERLGTAEYALELERPDARVRVVVAARRVGQREDRVADARVGGDFA